MDISGFGSMLTAIWQGIDIPMNIYGFTFSLRDVLMFSLVATVIFGAIGSLFRN